MPSDQHQGATAPGITQSQPDRRIDDIGKVLAQLFPLGRSVLEGVRDGYRAIQAEQGNFARANPIQMGVVVHSIPYANCHRVQLSAGGSFIMACCLSETGFMPLGVHSTSPIPPYSTVLIFQPYGLTYGIILGVIPEKIAQSKVVIPDWLVQGGQSGLKREDAHKQPIKNLYRAGGVMDFSSNRPIDSTALEWGRMSETGIALLLDSFQAYLRVDETCGLFLNYFDHHTRLAGQQLDVVSAIHELSARNDEGEPRLFCGEAIYPWEALGLYAKGTAFADKFDHKEVQYEIPKGAVDLPDGEEDTQPIYRVQQYGGYFGQGIQRFVMIPAKEDGKRRFADTEPDEGVFHEHIAIDGGYMLRAAKSVTIAKRVLIPVPKEIVLPEDATGDDSRKDNYKFAGTFGKGKDHEVKDVKLTEEPESLFRVATTLDETAYQYNWKGLHPAHYHSKDFFLPEEQDSPHFTHATENLDFDTLEKNDLMKDPESTKIKVDERYGEVKYYERESAIKLLPDGGVLIDDGYGARILLSGGNITLSCPGDVRVEPGKRFVAMVWDAIIRAKNSVDISAAEKDVRIKAEANIQILAGNGGEGGVLIESKAKHKNHVYENVYGEDVKSSGIILRADHSEVATLSNELYLKTGGGPIDAGNITIDAGKGTKMVNVYSSGTNFWNSDGVTIFHTSSPDSQAVVKGHYFGKQGTLIDDSLAINGNLLVTSDTGSSTVIVKGGVFASGSIGSGGTVASRGGGLLAKSGDSFKSEVEKNVKPVSDTVTKFRQTGNDTIKMFYVERYYTPKTALGNDTLLKQLMFSFRDPEDKPGKQYKTENLKFPEARWIQMARLKMGDGGKEWDEPPVENQGVKTYPWPGKDKWSKDEIYLRIDKLKMYDAEEGRSKERGSGAGDASEPNPYEKGEIGKWDKTTMKDGYKLIL